MDIFLIIIMASVWAYVAFCLINGRSIKQELQSGKRYSGLILFVIMALLLFIKNHSIVYTAFIILAGLVYNAIPSGYSEKAIYIKGRRFPYRRISNIEAKDEGSNYRLTFVYNGKAYYVLIDINDKRIIGEIEK